MPIEFSFSWLLYDPAYAAALGLTAILGIAAVAYCAASRKSPEYIDRYKRNLGLVAEVLVSLGIVGLITFAARSKIDAEIHIADVKSQELERNVRTAAWDFARLHCLRQATAVPPTKTMGTIYEACHWWPQVMKGPEEFVNWWGARERFQAMAAEPQLSPELRSTYAAIAEQIDQLLLAQSDHTLDKHKKKLLEHQFSWPFVAACAFFAIAGIAMKWARAALDLRPSRRPLV